MALTRNGKMTGYAAREAKRDLRLELMEQADLAIEKIKSDFGDLMSELRRLDPTGWSAWYDEHVPDWNDWINCEPVMNVIQQRIDELTPHSTQIEGKGQQ